MLQKNVHVCGQVVKLVLKCFALEFAWNMITVKNSLFRLFTTKTTQEKKTQFFLSILFIYSSSSLPCLFFHFSTKQSRPGRTDIMPFQHFHLISLHRVLNFQWYLINIGAVAILTNVYSFIIHLDFNWIENVYRLLPPFKPMNSAKCCCVLFCSVLVIFALCLFVSSIFILYYLLSMFSFFSSHSVVAVVWEFIEGDVFISVFIFSMDHLAKTWFIQWFDCWLPLVFVTLLSMKNWSVKNNNNQTDTENTHSQAMRDEWK